MQMRLIHGEVLELVGADALAFAQAQFMNDIRTLDDGCWQWSGWLTPKGRLVAFFAIVRIDEQTILLWLPAGGASVLADRLHRFVFRSKVSIRVATWRAFGLLSGRAYVPPADRTDDPANAVDALMPSRAADSALVVLELPSDPEIGSRQLVFVRSSETGSLPEPVVADSAARERWHIADLSLGIPYIGAAADNSEQFVPQWLSLERLHAYDLKKGCYPGQEIVARMHYLGKSKRTACALGGVGKAPLPLSRVTDGADGRLGEIVWSFPVSTGWRALAVIAVGTEDQISAVAGFGPATRLPSISD
jgi:folate-binding protein YgfZ